MTTNQPRLRKLRYQITPEDCASLRACLSARAKEREARSVHAMFFTSYRDRVPRDPMGEILAPERTEAQFSLHYYDNDPTYLILERRLDGRRTSAMVAEAECRALLAGETDWLLDRRNPLLREFHESLTERMLLPQVLLTYHREVYSADGLDLWVALDTDIRASLEHMDFLDPQQLERGVTGQDGRILLEISYSDRIPDDVIYLLEETAPRRRLLSGPDNGSGRAS